MGNPAKWLVEDSVVVWWKASLILFIITMIFFGSFLYYATLGGKLSGNNSVALLAAIAVFSALATLYCLSRDDEKKRSRETD